MRRAIAAFAGACASLLVCGLPASAHVGFVKRQIPLARTIESALRVPHGCNGSATLRVRMRIPRAVLAVRPPAKEGWTVSITGEGSARELAWTGRLPANETGVFPLVMDLDASAKAGDVIYFPVVQECESGVSRWIDVKGKPSADISPADEDDESSSPAPSIRLLPRK